MAKTISDFDQNKAADSDEDICQKKYDKLHKAIEKAKREKVQFISFLGFLMSTMHPKTTLDIQLTNGEIV